MKKDELAGKVDDLSDRAKQAVASVEGTRPASGLDQPPARSPEESTPARSGKTAAGDSAPARRAEGPAETVQDDGLEDDGSVDVDIDIDPEIEEADDE